MGKKAKKRNKKYTGVNAKRPTNVVRVHKVDAVSRSNFGQWLHDHQKVIKGAAIVVAILIVIIAGFMTLF